MSTHYTTAGTIFRVGITIPTTATRLLDLLVGFNHPESVVIKIAGYTAAGAERGAFTLANPRPGATIQDMDFTTHGQYIPAGQEYEEPCDADFRRSYLRAGTPTPATVIIRY